ncbi:unnamed protein product, partial [Tetraodon nigroviridis]
AATPLGVITVPGDSDLETCRLLIERLHDNLDQDCDDVRRESLSSQSLSKKWCFLDCESTLGPDARQSCLILTPCSLSDRYNCRPLLQDRPSSGTSELCDRDLSGGTLYPGSGVGCQGDGGHVPQHA